MVYFKHFWDYSQHYLIAEYQNSQEQVPSFTSNFGLFWT